MMRPAVYALIPTLLSVSSLAHALTYFVGPDGTGTECKRATPCGLATGVELAQAGDTVILLDGAYHESLNPEKSGTPDAWITFRADDCALPILEGPGRAVLDLEDAERPSGVFSNTGSYLRFVGLVSRNWDSGFSNGWTGKGTTNSNGHLEFINCVGDGNGRSGITMFSSTGVTIRECISAHNGGSPTDSWSSGIQLYGMQGTPEENLVERNVSFENIDAQKNTDGSGFIVDEDTMGSTFINNLAFRNGGSCIRLTRSENTRMLHFSCYHNGLNPAATSPTNPGEIYFNDSRVRENVLCASSLVAASGSEADPLAFMNPPDVGLSNNTSVDSGPAVFFTDPEGVTPDFRPPAQVVAQVENLGLVTTGTPDVDLGFDPKCLVKANPNVPYQQDWWIYSVDYEYIRSIGGVAKCFHPKQRTGGPDIGAYELSGGPHEFSTPGSCVRSPDPVDPIPTSVPMTSSSVPPAPSSLASDMVPPVDSATPAVTSAMTSALPANSVSALPASSSAPSGVPQSSSSVMVPADTSPFPSGSSSTAPILTAPISSTWGPEDFNPAPASDCSCRVPGNRSQSLPIEGMAAILLGLVSLRARRVYSRPHA